MALSFGTAYWVLFLILIVSASIVAAAIFYYRHHDYSDLSKSQIYILTALRLVSFFLVSFLLLTPFIRSLKKIIKKPTIIIALDNSMSLKNKSDSVATIAELTSFAEQLKKALGDGYQIPVYTFGEKTTKYGILNLSEKKSDYSDLINTVYNDYFSDNLGALVIAGDGIYNRGENPLDASMKLGFPVYSLGFGDTSVIRDSRVTNLVVNKTAFAGNFFPIEADLKFLKLKGVPMNFIIKKNDEIVYAEKIIPSSDDFFKTVSLSLEAKEPGLQHYNVHLEPYPGEQNMANNNIPFIIKILSNKQKIMILSDGSHPDIGAIKNVLDTHQNYEVSVFTGEPYPGDFKGNNLIILNQIPGTGYTGSDLLRRVFDSGVPILFIVGNRSFLPQFNQLDIGMKIIPQAGATDEAQASHNPLFALFTMSEGMIGNISKFPPLSVPFAEYKIDPLISVVFYQNVKNIQTSRPLVAAGSLAGRKTGLIAGEGIWRWRLYNYYFNNDHEVFEEFVNQLVQYLALKENEDNFNLFFQPVYAESDDIIFSAELFNETFDLVTSPDIYLTIKSPDGTELQLGFDKLEKTYRLNAGILPPGDYEFTAKTELGGSSYTESGNFAVMPVNSESAVNEANHKLLFQLAKQTGGNFFSFTDSNQLIADLRNNTAIKPLNYYESVMNEVLNLKAIFFMIIILFGAEWFLRKFWGIY